MNKSIPAFACIPKDETFDCRKCGKTFYGSDTDGMCEGCSLGILKILVLGADGYLGRALVPYLRSRGYEVMGIDNGLRHLNVLSIGSDSLVPISLHTDSLNLDILRYEQFKQFVAGFMPDAIVHFAEQPSAPFSMISPRHAYETQKNNILGTLNVLWVMREVCPSTHLVKLGTMGVYGTPDTKIPEHGGPIAYDPASFYHNSKAADSINIRKTCLWWGLKATDLHQGVVYGHIDGTRFDYDSYFGTVVNRFVVQAVAGIPLTVYGMGGQTRGFINIQNTLEAITLAIQNPPSGYRVFNQFTEKFSVLEIAQVVQQFTGCEIGEVKNPRVEKEQHFYEPTHSVLFELGLKTITMESVIPQVIELVRVNKHRINQEVIQPKTTWR